MIFNPVKIKDKLRREIVLRSAEVSDAEALIDYLRITAGETPYLVREPDEISLTVEQEISFIQCKIDSENELILVATLDGKHIGNCSLMGIAPYRRYAHRCGIAIALYKEYCGCGIGRIMMQTVLGIAKDLEYEQAELEVVSENKSAIEMYRSLGFERYGTFPKSMKYSDGTYADSEWMMKML
ncbi:MAG: GNAT family N-acetyltransferase [Clostridia bacterium]|nr:GNAT family N-acetyltransferase [Clostridia bacterium]MBR5454084.1 GNAT family N-acetyltransferase [Clostridia bacterium]